MEVDSDRGNNYTTPFRAYDARIGRWKSLDPVLHVSLSPYNSFDNSPILIKDPSGGNGDPVIKDGRAEIHTTFVFVKGTTSDNEFINYIEYFISNIEQNFVGRTYTDAEGNSYPVILVANYSLSSDYSDSQLLKVKEDLNTNIINVSKGDFDSSAEKGGNTAQMNIDNLDNTPFHEVLHLLGLDDRYQYAMKGTTVKNGVMLPLDAFKYILMPAEQLGENSSYIPNSNVMANAESSGMTNNQWTYIFTNKIEDTGQTTFFIEDGFQELLNFSILGHNNANGIVAFELDHYIEILGYFNPTTNVSEFGGAKPPTNSFSHGTNGHPYSLILDVKRYYESRGIYVRNKTFMNTILPNLKKPYERGL